MRQTYDDTTLYTLRQSEQLKLEGKYDQALALLERLLALNPDNVAALEEIADNELSLEHFDRAMAAAKRAVALDKESFTGHYILGFIASHNEEWNVSVTELKLANKTKQNNPEILRCIGWSLFNGGERMPGVVTLERALNLDPNNPLTLCDLGVVYLRMREFDKSKVLFQRAIDLDPENVRAIDCLEMAERIEKHSKVLTEADMV
jgi:tetratricopeptide (TPR) repeat protein